MKTRGPFNRGPFDHRRSYAVHRMTEFLDAPPFGMRLYDRDGWSVLEICGEMDIQGVPALRGFLQHAGPRLLYDLRGVTFIDCGGLRPIAAPAGGDAAPARPVLVSGPVGNVRRMLDLTGWEKGLSVYETVDDVVLSGV